jgi:hypothetical protein
MTVHASEIAKLACVYLKNLEVPTAERQGRCVQFLSEAIHQFHGRPRAPWKSQPIILTENVANRFVLKRVWIVAFSNRNYDYSVTRGLGADVRFLD